MTDGAGTPAPTPEVTPQGGTPVEAKDGSKKVEVSAEFQDEALRVWKPAAEEVKTLRQQLADERAQRGALERQVNGGQAATDPRIDLLNTLKQQGEFDPVAKATAITLEAQLRTEVQGHAEAWLRQQVKDVPESKRDKVADYIRRAGYQVDVQTALSELTDPEVKTLSEQLAQTKAQLAAATARPNGISPAAVSPSTANAADTATQETIERAEYVRITSEGAAKDAPPEVRARARELMRAVGSNKTKLKD